MTRNEFAQDLRAAEHAYFTARVHRRMTIADATATAREHLIGHESDPRIAGELDEWIRLQASARDDNELETNMTSLHIRFQERTSPKTARHAPPTPR